MIRLENENDYFSELKESDANFDEQLSAQIYQLAKVATKKYCIVKWSLRLFAISFDYFYNAGLNAFASQLKDEKMSKITRIILIESYHNDKIRDFLKKSIIEEAVNGWIVLFDLMKSKRLIREDVDSRQLAESFYKYGLFLLYEHYIINYPEDDAKFVDELCGKSQEHIKLLYDSVRR